VPRTNSFYGDSYNCAQEASPTREAPARATYVNEALYRACLWSRGYRRGEYLFGSSGNRVGEFMHAG